jgi:hypothetical protein
MLKIANIDLLNGSGGTTTLTNNATWYYSSWQGAPTKSYNLTGSYELGTLAPTDIEFKVEIRVPNETNAIGSIPCINSVSAGIVDWDEQINRGPVTLTTKYLIESRLKAGYEWRVGCRRQGGGATTTVRLLGFVEGCNCCE